MPKITESPEMYVLSYGVCWWVAPADPNEIDSDLELWVANEGSWEHAMLAKDVENWEGTPWESVTVTYDMCNKRRDALMQVFEGMVADAVQYRSAN